MAWGYQLILDCSGCDVEAISSKATIRACINELVAVTGLIKLGPLVFRFLPETPETLRKQIDGYSVFQGIQTSSIVIHFVGSTRSAYVDFFSCKKFQKKDVIACIQKYFGCDIQKSRFHKRG